MRMLLTPNTRFVSAIVMLVGAISGMKTAKADMLVSDLTSNNGSLVVPLTYSTSYAQFGAQQFTTGSQSTSISSFTVLLGDATSTYHGTIVAELLNQVGNLNFNPPGSNVLQTFATTQTLGADGTQVTFNATSSYTLSANTGYWIALGTSSGSTGSLDWTVFKDSVSNTGTGSIYDQYTFGSSSLKTGGRTGGEFSLAINDTVAVPEPSGAAIVALSTALISGYWCYRRRGRTDF